VGKKTTAKYEEGYAAAAKFINTKPDNIGSTPHPLFHTQN